MKTLILILVLLMIDSSNCTFNFMIFPKNNNGNICERMTNGCSVPTIFLKLGSTQEYSKLFEESCNRHDICYFCVSNSI